MMKKLILFAMLLVPVSVTTVGAFDNPLPNCLPCPDRELSPPSR